MQELDQMAPFFLPSPLGLGFRILGLGGMKTSKNSPPDTHV